MARSRRRTTTSAVVRSSMGECAGESSATNMISPMIEESGASTGGAMPSGSEGSTDDSFSLTVWRAR